MSRIGPTLSAADREKLARQFAACMRKNGIPEFPDPTVDQNGNLQLFGSGLGALTTVDREKIRTAFTACQQYAQGLRSGFSQQDQQQMQDAILAFAQCMRANGYDLPDPNFGAPPGEGASRSPGQDNGGPFGSINPNDPAFKKAFAACQSKLPGMIGGGSASGSGSAPPPSAS